MITQWLPQDLKLTSKYLWYSGYHNVCNIRVQTIYTYKNLNNSGEKDNLIVKLGQNNYISK